MINNYSSEPIHKLKIGNIEYAYFTKGNGPPVLILHGFPDNAISWLPLMNDFADAGYTAIVPFLRGYYPSGLSPDGNYSVTSVANDFLELMLTLGHDQFYLIGHDWGASIAYSIAAIAPERVIKMSGIAIPHPRAIKPSLKLLYQARHFILFQFHSFSLWYSKRNDYAYIDYIYKWWSPKWDSPPSFRQMMKDCFSETGYLDAALGYYRSFGKDSRNKAKAKLAASRTSVPTLVVVGDSDGAIDLPVFDKLDDCFTNSFEVVIIKDAGHFPHNEKPKELSTIILKYLQTK